MEFIAHYQTSSGIELWLPANILGQFLEYVTTNLDVGIKAYSKRNRNPRATCSMHPDDRYSFQQSES